jgi:hypothetical protein
MLVGLNVLAAAVALYTSLEASAAGTAVVDVLQVLAGITLLTAIGLTYLLVRKKSETSGL